MVDVAPAPQPAQPHPAPSRPTPEKHRSRRGKPDILCDRFFVDGDHSEPQVTNDFYAAIRFTRPGGLVLIDDVRARARSVPLAACLAIALFQTRY